MARVVSPKVIRLLSRQHRGLAERTRELADFFENAPCGYHSLDGQGRIIRVNRTELGWLGYSRDDLVGRRSLSDLLAPESRDRWDVLFTELMTKGTIEGAELDLVRRDGSVFTVLQSCSVYRDPARTFLRTRCTLVDISERKHIERALRLSESRLADSQRIAKLGSWEWDLPGNALWWSDEIFRIFGLDPAHFGATYEAFLATVHPADREAVKHAVDAALYLRQPYSIDHRIVRPDGQERIVHEQAEVTYDGQDKPLKMAGTVQDVTEYRQAQVAIAKRTADLAHAQELETLRTNFVNAVAHDLRQPITAIQGYAELLDDELEGPLNAAQRKDVWQILHDVGRLDNLVEHLLDAVRSEAGHLTLHLETVSIADLAAGAVSSLRPRAVDKNLRLSLSLEPDLPEVQLDRARVERVLINLVENAAKFTPPGRAVTVEVRREDGLVRVEVADEGVGIRSEDIPRLFQRFSQVGTGPSEGGLGLGLSTCKAIVEAHGGRIGVESAPEVGSRFWFVLPVTGPREAEPGG